MAHKARTDVCTQPVKPPEKPALAVRMENQEEKAGMKRHRILYEDKELLVVWKPSGLAVQSARVSEPDIMSILRNDLAERGQTGACLRLVNRLDQPVEGIFLVAKTEQAAADLGRQVSG